MASVAMRQLTWIQGAFSAHVLAARLRSEGIDVELRGAVGSPYGLTVGDMARVDFYVPEDQMDDAQLVLLAAEVDDALAAPREWAGASPAPRWVWVVALALLIGACLAPVIRWLATT
jgi:hypothetical protein